MSLFDYFKGCNIPGHLFGNKNFKTVGVTPSASNLFVASNHWEKLVTRLAPEAMPSAYGV